MDEYNSYNNIDPGPSPTIPEPQPPQASNGMATASLVLGICALVFFCCGGFILGALGIILALLSRGTGRMNGTAKTGLGLSIASLVVGVITYIVYITLAFTSGTFWQVMEQYQPYYFESRDRYEEYDNFWGPDIDDYNNNTIDEKIL